MSGPAEDAEAGPAEGPDAGPAAQAPVGWLPSGADTLFGAGATAEEAYALLTVDVPPERWLPALAVARDELGCDYFDWLSAVDEPGHGFRVCAHLVALPEPVSGRPTRRLVVRTTVGHDAPALPTATGLFAGAGWHERETHEMFGLDFTGHPHLVPLLLPEEFEGHPLRKDFVLAARVAKAWPGAKEPGESGHGGPKRRQMQPPGVPDPNEWGPLKGQLPPAPARPARGRAGAAGAAGDRPARRARTAGAGSASQRPAAPDAGEETTTDPPARPPRRARTAGGGSASQRTETDAAPGTDAAQDAPAQDAPADAASSSAGTSEAAPRPAGPGAGDETDPPAPSSRRAATPGTRSTDAPWRHPEGQQDGEPDEEPPAPTEPDAPDDDAEGRD